MQLREDRHIVRGMVKDLSESKFSNEFVFDALNIRVTAREQDTSLLSITNEKGTKEIELDYKIEGTVLGYCVLNNLLTVFTHLDSSTDFIYRIEYKREGVYEIKTLFDGKLKGSLNFDSKHPIETLGVFENKDIQKIYWVDGINQTRVINIVSNEDTIQNWDNNSFDFIQNLQLKEKVNIYRQDNSGGVFHSGTLQYVFTYFNKYGQETNIFHQSELLYTSHVERGGSPEDSVGNSFRIKIKGVDERFQFIRIYSIQRTSLDGTPQVRKVVDIPLNNSFKITKHIDYYERIQVDELYLEYLDGSKKRVTDIQHNIEVDGERNWTLHNSRYSKLILPNNTFIKIEKGVYSLQESSQSKGFVCGRTIESNSYPISLYHVYKDNIEFIDNGTVGEIVDSSILLFVGGEEIVFKTMSQKDNTLFLGNAKIKRTLIPKEIREEVQNGFIKFYTNTKFSVPDIKGYYPHKNQLDLSSKVKGFKYLEWCRFGIQAQHITGKWSEPLFISDEYNGPTYTGDTNYAVPVVDGPSGVLDKINIGVPAAKYNIPPRVKEYLLNNNFVKVRGVVVFPEPQDREVIAQGIVCPTMYNARDRYSNSPFAFPSWFSRPMLQHDIEREKDNMTGEESPGAIVNNGFRRLSKHDIVNKGAWAEFRHNYNVPNCDEKNSEVQCLIGQELPYIDREKTELSQWVSDNAENMYIDQGIVNLYSPDIDFNLKLKNINSSGLKFRIVGQVEVTSNSSSLDFQTTKPPYNKEAPGKYEEVIGSKNISIFGVKSMLSTISWIDLLFPDKDFGEGLFENEVLKGSVIYPWHSDERLSNGMDGKSNEDKEKYARLKSKKLSNLKYSLYTKYFTGKNNSTRVWRPDYNNYNGITDVRIVPENMEGLIKIPSPENSNLSELNYFPNVDKIVNISRADKPYTVFIRWEDSEGKETFRTLKKYEGFPKMGGSVHTTASKLNSHNIFKSRYSALGPGGGDKGVYTSYSPVRIKYQTSAHAVFAFNYSNFGGQCILPTFKDYYTNYPVNKIQRPLGDSPFWDKENTELITQDTIETTSKYGMYWMGELYRDNVENRFGGISEEAFTQNTWLPAGDTIDLRTEWTVPFNQGDTFFQRYDCLKTFTTDTDQFNSVTEIVSFMVESRLNLDGRYDRNRGQVNNTLMSPKNFNLLNPVYSQDNNYYKYHGVNIDDFSLDDFPNTVTWTKEKTMADTIDLWTNITMASTLDLDGDKGEIESLNTYNNEIFCFQKNALSNIIFNPRVQIPASDGVPIEITNSMKVQGKRYISNTVGCNNKWSIVESPDGLYFADNITNSIYLFNGQLKSITDENGFRSWMSKHTNIESWNPEDFNNIISYYDRNNNDIYFVGKDYTLGYSELLRQFTSFYSYEKTPAMFNINSEFYSIKNGKLWNNFRGDYNSFFGEIKPFNFTIISNNLPQYNKIFNTVEYRAYTLDDNDKDTGESPFDFINVYNEYQEAKEDLINRRNYPSNLKRKFRVWRVNIPRDNRFGRRTRISNPWAYVQLGNNNPGKKKIEFHDLSVHYTL